MSFIRLLFSCIACLHTVQLCQCFSGSVDSPGNCGRRGFVIDGVSIGLSVFGLAPSLANAAAPMDAAEAIRRGAANIPGYGQTDVFYPSSFAGSWTMVREVERSGRDPLVLQYPFRFVQSIEDSLVVADRGFNQAELEKSILREVSGADETASIRSYEWEKNNPNDLRLLFSDGFRKDIKVTKRATELTDETVSSSEFQRLTLDDGRVPSISARRILTKWKVLSEKEIEGIEVVYSVPGSDPLAVTGNTMPTIISKSRLSLKRF